MDRTAASAVDAQASVSGAKAPHEALEEMRCELVELRFALAHAAIPLEVLHGQDSYWAPVARWRYRRVISRELRASIALAVEEIRTALGRRPQAPVAGAEGRGGHER